MRIEKSGPTSNGEPPENQELIVSSGAPGENLKLRVSDWGEPHPYHEVFFKLEANIGDGKGFASIPLPSSNCLDYIRLIGASSHYSFNASTGILIVPNMNISKETPIPGQYLAYQNEGDRWSMKSDLVLNGVFLGISCFGHFLFLNQRDLLLVDATASQIESTISLLGESYANAHLSEDRSQVLVIKLGNRVGELTPVFYNLVDIATAKSLTFNSATDSDEIPLVPFDARHMVFPMDEPESIGGVMGSPVWGRSSYQIDVEVS
jgi:hypothetical protein